MREFQYPADGEAPLRLSLAVARGTPLADLNQYASR